MIDYDKIYIDILDYLGKEFDFGLVESALQAETITLIVKKNVEDDISNYEEEE